MTLHPVEVNVVIRAYAHLKQIDVVTVEPVDCNAVAALAGRVVPVSPTPTNKMSPTSNVAIKSTIFALFTALVLLLKRNAFSKKTSQEDVRR